MTNTDTDYLYALLSEGKLDLMYLPSGAVAWLFDRPDAQVKSAATLGMMAKDVNPITGGSCLRADDNILILTCEGGQKFRIYPDGGVSVNGEVSDFTGCQQAMNTSQQPEMPQDECGPGCPCDDCQQEAMMDDEFNNMAAPMEDHGDYSDEEMEEVARAQGTYEFANEADESQLRKMLAKGSNMFGGLKPDIKKRILTYFQEPTEENWDDAYSIIISGRGKMPTLWQAWAAVDPSAPKSKPYEGRWPSIPDVFTLKKAIATVLTQTESNIDLAYLSRYSHRLDEDKLSYEELENKLFPGG